MDTLQKQLTEIARGFAPGEIVFCSTGRRSGRTTLIDNFIHINNKSDPESVCNFFQAKPRVQQHAVEITPRQHKRRRGQTDAYHKKVQKRWNKRAKSDSKFQISSTPKVIIVTPEMVDLVFKRSRNEKLSKRKL